MPFYLKKNDAVVGPYARAELKDMLKHGEIRATIPAKEEGDQHWSTLEECLYAEKDQAAAAQQSPIPPQFRGTPFAPRPLGSTMGFTAYKKFATATRKAARSVASISFHRKSPRRPKPTAQPQAATAGRECKRDLIYGALWFIGGILGIVLGYVFSKSLPVNGLHWVFGGPVIYGGIMFLRGLGRFVAKR